jgi:hypothetical protein
MWGKPTDLMFCCTTTLLIRLNIVPTRDRKATELVLLSGWSKCGRQLRATVKWAQLIRLPALCQDCIQPCQQSAGPTQHQICGFAPHEIIQSPSSSQRPPRTKDTRCLQDPLWVQQGLHWADRLFCGHEAKGTSTAHPTRTSRQVSLSRTHTLTISTEKVVFASANHGSLFLAP